MATDAVLTGFINGALRQVAMMQDWDWNWSNETITTVAGQDVYDRAADARKTDIVSNTTTGDVLGQISKRLGVRYTDLGRTGPPRYWYVQGGKLVIVPLPDQVYALKHVYVATEPTLSADSDEPDLPTWAVDVVIVKAAIMVTARTDNTSQQRLLEQEERDLLDNLDDEAKRSRGSIVIDSRRDWRL
jgi:hypothetical protein